MPTKKSRSKKRGPGRPKGSKNKRKSPKKASRSRRRRSCPKKCPSGYRKVCRKSPKKASRSRRRVGRPRKSKSKSRSKGRYVCSGGVCRLVKKRSTRRRTPKKGKRSMKRKTPKKTSRSRRRVRTSKFRRPGPGKVGHCNVRSKKACNRMYKYCHWFDEPGKRGRCGMKPPGAPRLPPPPGAGYLKKARGPSPGRPSRIQDVRLKKRGGYPALPAPPRYPALPAPPSILDLD